MEADFDLRNLKFACVLIICRYLAVAYAIRALRLPASITAIEGGRAEFNCTTANKVTDEELYWAIKWDDGSLLMWYYLPAEVNKTHEDFLRGTALLPIRAAALGDHGRYSTVHREVRYSDGQSLDFCLLQVDDIHDEDQGRFHCVYRRDGSFRNLYASEQSGRAELTVVVPPDGDAPSCGVSQVASADPTLGGALVELSCISSMIAVDPLPTITWKTADKELSSSTGNANLYRYTLQEKDNGRVFTCIVTHPSLTDASSCSVLPLNEPPNVVITPETLVAAVGSDAVFKCIGSGIPYIVKYTWFVGDSSFSHPNTDGVITPEISFVGSKGWVLSLPNLKNTSNNTRVTCKVSLPSGLSSNASAVLLLRDSLPLGVSLSPKRARAFKDLSITFSCFAETNTKHLTFKWYVNDSIILLNETADRRSFKIQTIGQTGSMLMISNEKAAAFVDDVSISCEAIVPTGTTARDSGVLISQKNTKIQIDISPKVTEVPVGAKATITCITQPSVLPNSTFLWLVRCDPDLPTGQTSTSGFNSKTLTLDNLDYETRCAVTCSVSVPSGLSASGTGLVVVQTLATADIGEVQQPETQSTSWRLPGALGAGGIGIFLGVCFCTMLLLLYTCSKSFFGNNKARATTSRSQVSTPIYETINPQNGSRDHVGPDVPMVRTGPCQQQSNATYNRPPLTLPKVQVALPAHSQRARGGLQRIPSSENEEAEGSVASSISKDSLDTELGMNSSPSTATFVGPSDSDEHEYESCEITTCV
ncbi:protein turtle homolog A-like [Acanthaster planci]|uniref:Protein turtle homolog A-like n=1 Tax=Acanthaster planci TaxID=133434 RepID=A0A8B7Y5W8_ACAPL|nr:protein turtle homolog A-like [Acanthaster planci]XP_022088594.1 protein turtle homolog A-like [Acanthaster planci]XP_022088602.1 protein turtle homolog A-like [Acanthaster planci]